jgi:hypothetical protein
MSVSSDEFVDQDKTELDEYSSVEIDKCFVTVFGHFKILMKRWVQE